MQIPPFRVAAPAAYAALCETMECNRAFFRLLASYLNDCPCLVTESMIRDLCEACGVDEREAFCAVLSAAFGLEEEHNAQHRRLVYDYLRQAVRRLDPSVYEADPYYQNIRIPTRRAGRWKLGQAEYAPYEGFVCGPLVLDARFCERPPVGYFSHDFSYPAVFENGVEWMAIKPNEIETMRAPIAKAGGRVLTYGLGLGYFAYMVARKEEVTSLVVVERERDIISLFEEEILPQFGSAAKKITLVQADAFAYAESAAGRGFDFVFADLWHDAGDGLPLYLRMRRIEQEKGDRPYAYWIEDMLLSRLRSMVFDRLRGPDAPPIGRIEEVYTMLGDEYLRRLAADLRAAQA